MALPLTTDRLRLAYELLAECPPFDKWNLPHGEDVRFRVSRKMREYGQHRCTISNAGRYTHHIEISSMNVTTMETLLRTMAHEMIHVHEQANEVCTPHQSTLHTEAFRCFALEVCKSLGFNPDSF
jgi:hypothetical protein